MARICIDGFNLALPAGTGIATYARNLHGALGSLGHDLQVLFATPRKLRRINLLNEIALFDSRPERGIGARFSRLRRMIPLLNPRAKEIRMTGDVIAAAMSHRFPPSSRYWGSHDIFHSANAAYSTFKHFTPVRLGWSQETDIMHWTAPLPLFEPRLANVYTLHDLIPLRLPFASLDNKDSYYYLCKSIVRRADRIFTVSEHSRKDIIHLLGAAEDKVVNTYQAVDVPARFRERTKDDVARELEGAFGLEPGGYFLYFGALEPKKNLRRIVEAYLASAVKRPLVVVGRAWIDQAWLTDDTLGSETIPEALLSKVPVRRQAPLLENSVQPSRLLLLNDRILRYEYLPFAALVTLIQGARATLFPSLYEGFGLPVLESMQLGTPVLASTAGSLPEIAGDAALLVDPYDIDAIRKAMQALDSDADLRSHLIEKGQERAAMFSTERYRERLIAAYKPLL